MEICSKEEEEKNASACSSFGFFQSSVPWPTWSVVEEPSTLVARFVVIDESWLFVPVLGLLLFLSVSEDEKCDDVEYWSCLFCKSIIRCKLAVISGVDGANRL
jgi:hypothetical protein